MTASHPTSLPPDTRERVLSVAERLAQTRGFNGFSYADIATELRLTRASLHYHFPSKADLGRALIIRYADRFSAALAEIDGREENELAKVTRFIRLYEQELVRDRMCLCGMFAAEIETLPEPMRAELRRFFDVGEAWLTDVFRTGGAARRLRFEGAAGEAAQSLTATLQGAMLLARAYGDSARFARATERLLAKLVE